MFQMRQHLQMQSKSSVKYGVRVLEESQGHQNVLV